MQTNLKSQPARLIILLVYIGILFVANYFAFGGWLPSAGAKGLWFYSGFARVLLGSLLVTPFFTKPVSAISYSVPSIIAIYLVNDWLHWGQMNKIIYVIALGYCIFILLIAFTAILTKDINKSFGQKVSKTCMVLSDYLGNPRTVFSIVIIFALIAFHRSVVREMFVITLAWAIAIVIKPDEIISILWQKMIGIWGNPMNIRVIGRIAAYQTPNILLVSQDEKLNTSFGMPLVFNDAHTKNKTALALNYVGRDENLLLRALEFEIPEKMFDQVQKTLKLMPIKTVAEFNYLTEEKERAEQVPLLKNLDELVGIVAEDTSIERLYFEVIKEIDLEEGKLVSVDIRGQNVLYQVIDGFTKEDIVNQKNKYGYARGKAKKIGVWENETKRFKPAKWIPFLNTPVFLQKNKECIPDENTIGHFPGSNYTVGIKDINSLITHNTAILGILGVGKSFLAIELVERIISNGIKVICIDLTNQYATELKDFYDKELEQRKIDQLQKMVKDGGKNNIQLNKEEGGGINKFVQAMKNELTEFIKPDCPYMLKIYNPSQFDVWRQTGGVYNSKAAMASLTPTELTQVITESVLGICQGMGMTDKAKVCLVYEEAHSLIPEWNSVATEGDKEATNATARAILQGRKFGLGCLLVTQRTANVTKTILNQCNTIFAMRTFDETGKDFLSNYIGKDYTEILSTIQEQQAVFYGKASTCENPVLIQLNKRDDFKAIFRTKYPPPELPKQEIVNEIKAVPTEDK